MISIIVSSYNPIVYKQFEESVKQTIGVPYELIRIENPGLMGICEAYNTGGQKAKFPYLCFSHEDLVFHTDNWGTNLINHFLGNQNLGLIGVAGSAYKPYVLSGWASSWAGNMGKININQASKEDKSPVLIKNLNPLSKLSDRVVTLDGCFLCTKSSVFATIKFDQEIFKLYHCYDIDYAMTVSEKYNIEVVFDILFTHLSTGGYDKKWLDETVKMHNKWSKKLPYSIYKLSKVEISQQEIGAFYWLLNKVLQLNYGYRQLLRINFSRKFIRLVGFRNWLWIQIKMPKSIYENIAPSRTK